LDIKLLITHLHFYETCPSIICKHSTHTLNQVGAKKNYALISHQCIVPSLWAHPINPKPSTKWPNLSKKGGRHTLWQIAPICTWIPPRAFHALWLTRRLRGKKGHNEPAPTSTPSTRCLLLLSGGWTSSELIFSFTLVTYSVGNRSHK
jgi:hypothetical protein